MDVSIIFVNYNTIKLLIDAIDSVITQTNGVSYEIIVVDNNSSDNSQKILAENFGERVQYISLPENIGFGRANNEGFKVASGRYAYCLNPDTILMNNAIRELFDYIELHPEVGVVGSQLYNVDGSLQSSYSYYYPSLKSKINDLFGSFFRRKHKQLFMPTEVASVYGASMMIRREIVEQTGGFDSRFFMYAEEEEWCYRIHKLEYKMVCVPSSYITHLDGGSFELSEVRIRRRRDGERTFFQVVYSPFVFFLIKSVDYFIIISRIVIFTILRNKSKLTLWKSVFRNRL